jgi:hypothetical protein
MRRIRNYFHFIGGNIMSLSTIAAGTAIVLVTVLLEIIEKDMNEATEKVFEIEE